MIALDSRWITPDWPLPPGVHAAVSTRLGPGVSLAPFERFNLGANTDDDPAAVAANRRALADALALPSPPQWLKQVHGCDVVTVSASPSAHTPVVDASVTRAVDRPLVILTADCLPVLFAGVDGSVVGSAHAGWRGLGAGVLEATLAAMAVPPQTITAWLGPCIGAASYEVGAEVRQAFVSHDPSAASCFAPTRPGHWLCDLAALARQRLRAAGVASIHGGGFDTLTDPRLYSYRRNGACSGRFASLIWIVSPATR